MMGKLRSIDEFKELQEKVSASRNRDLPTIVIPAGTCCQASGANDLVLVAKRELLWRKLTSEVLLRVTGCHGFCQMEPSVLVEPRGIFYPKVTIQGMERIIDAVAKGEVLEDELFKDPETGTPIEKQKDIPFFRKQVRAILGRNEKIDPLLIFDYIATGGYFAAAKVLGMGDPQWVIQEVKTSGLRGRGGAGFSAGLKWEFLARQSNGQGKFLVCNADEGDPGAYMDRSLLEGNPHSIIEGMVIGAFATGATHGVIYVRNEYPLAIKHLIIAIRQARELGLLGEDILGKGFNFDINLVKGAGAFVCGEETALIHSIEGKIGEPRQRPPFPVQKGIEGKPTAINNVETWSNIPVIIGKGAKEFTRIGTDNNSGTKIFSLVGKVKYTGLVEVPMGTTIKSIVYDIGGGPVGDAMIKAVQTGGPSGGCIPAERFDLPVDYDSLSQAGSIMGSGGMIVMDEKTCMVDVAKYFMGFLKEESCGKCLTCRKGIQRMHEMLEDISQGNSTQVHTDLLKELAEVVKDASMCGLGQTASNPVMSTLRYFEEEYHAHIRDHRCPAGVCRALITFSINERCRGCQLCVKACPQGAISGEKKEPHVIDQAACIRCGACQNECKMDAIDVC
jgi:NADH-quinone oxidoreductase subunit F